MNRAGGTSQAKGSQGLHKGEPVMQFASAVEWERWLAKHHEADGGLWIRHARKASGFATVTYPEAVEVALCWGWIDGQVAPENASFYLQRYTARRRKSRWSLINRGKAETLIACGRMRRPGMAQVEAARADGRWDAAYSSPATISVPVDFESALAEHPRALRAFLAVSRHERYRILSQLEQAVRPATRRRRIETFLSKLAEARPPNRYNQGG